jgi:hypothetical protein
MGTFYFEALVDPKLETFSSSFGDTWLHNKLLLISSDLIM